LETGNENDSPRGRIYLMRALQEGKMGLEADAVRHLDLCLGCRACEAACPSGVQYGALLEGTRDHIEKQFVRSPFQQFLRRVAIERVFPYPARMKMALLPARIVKWLGVERWLPTFARDALSLIPEKIAVASSTAEEFSAAPSEKRKGRVGLIRGCVMSVLFQGTNASTVQLLNDAGYDVVIPPSQGCCGALHAHTGTLETARDFARKMIAAFENIELDAIIINAAGCGSTLKEYGHLLEHDPAWVGRARIFSAKVKDLSEWLAQHRPPIATSHSAEDELVTYHDACHLAHAQRITKAPRDLVRAVAGSRFVDLPEADVCCGSAGTYNLTEPEMAERLQKRKIENILRTGASVVVTSNPGCILQIQAGLKRAGANQIEVLHLADYLERARRG
jgi:glycolate oxidase iron-sulfur subunit